MYKAKLHWLLFLLIFVSHLHSPAQFSFRNGTANTTKGGLKSVRLLNEVSSNAELSQYVGNLNSKTDAAGFFQIKKVNGNWYLVDPDGCLLGHFSDNELPIYDNTTYGNLLAPDF